MSLYLDTTNSNMNKTMTNETGENTMNDTGHDERPTFTRRKIQDVLADPRPDEEYYVLAVLGYPKFAPPMKAKGNPFDVHERDFAPDGQLFGQWDKLSPTEWHGRMRERAINHDFVERALQYAEEANGRDVVFCCYEENHEDCHVHTLLSILDDALDEDEAIVHTREDFGAPKLDTQTGLGEWESGIWAPARRIRGYESE